MSHDRDWNTPTAEDLARINMLESFTDAELEREIKRREAIKEREAAIRTHTNHIVRTLAHLTEVNVIKSYTLNDDKTVVTGTLSVTMVVSNED